MEGGGGRDVVFQYMYIAAVLMGCHMYAKEGRWTCAGLLRAGVRLELQKLGPRSWVKVLGSKIYEMSSAGIRLPTRTTQPLHTDTPALPIRDRLISCFLSFGSQGARGVVGIGDRSQV